MHVGTLDDSLVERLFARCGVDLIRDPEPVVAVGGQSICRACGQGASHAARMAGSATLAAPAATLALG
jgi:hypothetical protein